MREANIEMSMQEFESMGIEDLLALSRDAGIENLDELACHGTGAIVQLEAERRLDEPRLDELEYVNKWEYVSESESGHLYIISFTAPDLPESLTRHSEELVGTCDPELTDESASMSLVGAQESIAGTIKEFESAGVTPDLRKLGTYTGGEGLLDGLTDRQREVLQTAFDLGYFEVPRKVSTEEIGDALGIDPSTVAEHLQRAERNVFKNLL